MSSPTRLITLPLDGFRAILPWLDLHSLVLLFCTFDRRMQRLLCLPSTFSVLTIPRDSTIKQEPLRYFLSSIRNVDELVLGEVVQWSARSMSLLTTLNPLRLTANNGFLHSSVDEMVLELKKDPERADLREKLDFFQPSGFPDFARLTTRLEHLTIDIELNTTDPFSLPPTLTSFEWALSQTFPLYLAFHKVVNHARLLPSNLRSLSINKPVMSFVDIMDHFTGLEELKLKRMASFGSDSNDEYGSPKMLEWPSMRSTLRTLVWHSDCDNLTESLFSHCSIAASSLHSVDIDAREEKSPSPAAYWLFLPPTVYALRLAIPSPLADVLTFLPLQLHYLHLDTPKMPPALIEALYALNNLEELVLKASIEISASSDRSLSDEVLLLGLLPKCLKKLSIQCLSMVPLSNTESVEIPFSLSSLSLGTFALEDLDTLRDRAPRCCVTIEQRIQLMSSPNGQYILSKFKEHLSPVLNVAAFCNALSAYCASRHTYIQVAIALGTAVLPETTECEFIAKDIIRSRNVQIPAERLAEKAPLALLCPNLTAMTMQAWGAHNGNISLIAYPWAPPPKVVRLDFRDSIFKLNMSFFPATLTWLSSTASLSDSELNSTKWPFLALKHLDTPNWDLGYQTIGNKDQLEVFKATISNFPDFQIVPFLTSLRPESRPGTSLTLLYYVTGKMMSQKKSTDGVFVPGDWKGMRSVTNAILERLLASTIPPLSKPFEASQQSQDPQIQTDSTATQTIGRMVKSLSCDPTNVPLPLVHAPPEFENNAGFSFNNKAGFSFNNTASSPSAGAFSFNNSAASPSSSSSALFSAISIDAFPVGTNTNETGSSSAASTRKKVVRRPR